MKNTFSIMTAGVLLMAASPLLAQTVFFTGFEYSSNPIIIEPLDMNGANGQVGKWSGDQIFPEGIGDILFLPDSVGIVPSPFGGSMLLLDRPGGDFENNGADLTGSYFADFTEPVSIIGAQVSFQVGVRRTSGNAEKDFDVIGRDSNGVEAFRLRVSARDAANRLTYVDANGSQVVDFDTVFGEDQDEDLGNIGGFNVDNGPGANQEIANVLVRLGPDGYAIDFSYPEGSTSSRANAYLTDLISYNNPVQNLARLEFTYEASGATGRNSGYVLDDVRVAGLGDVLLGDFDGNGVIDVNDFNVLAGNFGNAPANFEQGDFNFDGQIGIRDFIGLKAAFNAQPAGAAAVPEPTGLALLFVGGTCLGVLRRLQNVVA